MKRIFIYTVVLAMASCTTSYRIKSSDTQDIDKGKIQQVSKIAEYRVESKKISGSYSGPYKNSRPSYYIDLAKEIATGNTISEGKCDFLVHPLYDITVVGSQITCQVEGYPAYYTSFKTWNRVDSIPIGYVPVKTSNTKTTTIPKKKKNVANHHSKMRILFPIDFSVTIDGCSGWSS